MFKLHRQLAEDTLHIGSFPLCDVLLMNDARYPWVILVPRREGLSETYDLNEEDQQQCMVESNFVSKYLAGLVQAEKMNVAALGNIVNQLHIHHIARFYNDESWPNPVWGRGQQQIYSQEAAADFLQKLKQTFSELLQDG